MQGELFKMAGPVTEASSPSVSQPSWLDCFRITLRLDHLSMIGISALVLYVLVFSFGVEKGKGITLRELEAEKAKGELSALPPPATPLLDKAKPEETGNSPKTPLAVTSVAPQTLSPQKTGKYTIQVITFTSQSRAEEEVRRLKEKGYQSFVIPGGRFFQVCVDAFENLTEARQKLMRLKIEGFAPPDAYIRPLKGQISL